MGGDQQQEGEEEKKKCVKQPEKEINSAIRKVQDQDRKIGSTKSFEISYRKWYQRLNHKRSTILMTYELKPHPRNSSCLRKSPVPVCYISSPFW